MLFARLGAVVLGGLLVLVAGIAKSGVVALLGGVLTLLSSLVMMESFTHRREGQAVLPALIGATVSAVGAAAGLIGHWTDVSVVFGVAFVVWLGQVVWNWPKSQKRMRAEIDEAIRQQSAFPSKGA